MDVLYSSVVGSHAWHMERPDSDWDYWDIYQAPSTDFLLGKTHVGGHESKGTSPDGTPWDRSSFEIGAHLDQVRAGNINHIVCLFAPSVDPIEPRKIIEDNIIKKVIQEIVRNNPSKNVFRSINGMTFSNLRKYFDEEKKSYLPDIPGNARPRAKKLAQILRLVLFGYRVLTKKEYVLEPCRIGYGGKEDEDLVRQWQADLVKAFDASELPGKPDEEPYNDFLLSLRMTNLNNTKFSRYAFDKFIRDNEPEDQG
jgi:hypothetical protein